MPARSLNLDETALIAVAHKATLGGAATGALGFISQINWIGWLGALAAVIGVSGNFYFQIRRDRRETTLHRAQLAALRANIPPDD